MVERALWLHKLAQGWDRRSLVWLSGVRRVGKTTLARVLPSASYFNCDFPSVRQALEDPELFLRSQTAGSMIVLDEVHRLPDPSQLLKIAADEFPSLKILATGSSMLAATEKFSDALNWAEDGNPSRARVVGRVQRLVRGY